MTTPAMAQPAIAGFVGRPCSEFSSTYQAAGNDPLRFIPYENAVMGFASGANWLGYITEGIAPLDGITDMHVLLHSLDVYCNKNPRAIIALGIEQFLLVRRKMLLNQGAPH